MHRVGAGTNGIEGGQHDPICRVGYGFVNLGQKLLRVHDTPRIDDDKLVIG